MVSQGFHESLDFVPGRLTRSWMEGAPMQVAKPRDAAYFRAAARLLRRLHTANVIHNDLAKETNWLVTPDGRPALVDFQLAMTLTTRGSLARALGHDDIRHLLKHKRSYLPEKLTAREKKILATPSLLSRLWMASGKRSIYSSRAGYSAGAIAKALVIAAPPRRAEPAYIRRGRMTMWYTLPFGEVTLTWASLPFTTMMRGSPISTQRVPDGSSTRIDSRMEPSCVTTGFTNTRTSPSCRISADLPSFATSWC